LDAAKASDGFDKTDATDTADTSSATGKDVSDKMDWFLSAQDEAAAVVASDCCRTSFWMTIFIDSSALFAQDLIFDLLAGERGVLGGPVLLIEAGSDEEYGCDVIAR
jgi:hypothetical protein